MFYMIGTMGTWSAASVLWFNLEENAMVTGWIVVAGAYAIMFAVLFISLRSVKAANPDWSMKGLWHELLFRNCLDMRDDLSAVVGYLPKTWALVIKHILPPLLLVLFINLASAKVADGQALFGNYEGYPDWPYQIMGIFIVGLTVALFSLGVIAPDAFICLIPAEKED